MIDVEAIPVGWGIIRLPDLRIRLSTGEEYLCSHGKRRFEFVLKAGGNVVIECRERMPRSWKDFFLGRHDYIVNRGEHQLCVIRRRCIPVWGDTVEYQGQRFRFPHSFAPDIPHLGIMFDRSPLLGGGTVRARCRDGETVDLASVLVCFVTLKRWLEED